MTTDEDLALKLVEIKRRARKRMIQV